MKTIIPLIIVTFLTFFLPARSQDISAIMKGKRVVGGGIALSWTDNELETDNGNTPLLQDVKRNSFSFRPYAGKFIKDRLLLGGGPLLFLQNGETQLNDPEDRTTLDDKQFNVGLGVFLRKYYPIVGKFGAFVQPSTDFRIIDRESNRIRIDNTSQEILSEYSDDVDGFRITAGINLGLYVFLGGRFSLETNLGNITVNHIKEDIERRSFYSSVTNNEDRQINSFDINLVNQISFDQLFVINYFF